MSRSRRPLLSALTAVAVLAPWPGAVRGGDAASTAWPSFRGRTASGVANSQNLPDTWDGTTGANIRWKTRIPGLAHSSPVSWGQHLYVTTAVSSRGEATFKHGLYGSGDASDDRSPHQWKIFCLDSKSGAILWERTAAEGPPQDKRHVKATYANSTPATDGEHIVALFGSEGLHAFDTDGNRLWQRDLGRFDVGAYDLTQYEWGSATSPIIWQNQVFVQVDTQGEDFLIALDIKTGKTLWKTPREELPSWGTPTVFEGPARAELITNGSNFIRGYDPATGKELWRLGGSSEITAPTPIVADDLIIVTSGRRPEKPIFVIRPGASGDITLAEGATSNASVVWSKLRRGPYMPTPIVDKGLLYVINNDGVLDCYDLATGEEIYRERIPHAGGGFSASPVMADGKLYLSSEDGDVFVVRTGRQFELLATNNMGELLMATPALANGTLYIRATRHLFAVGRAVATPPTPPTTADKPR